MVAPKRLPPWHEDFRLSDGRQMLVRPIRAEDAAPIRGAWPLFEPETLRRRALGGGAEPAAEALLRLSTPDPRNAFVLVAAEPLPPGEAVIGALAAAALQPGRQDARFHLLVSRFVHGQGLSRHLLLRLVKWARGRGVASLAGEVPADNAPLRELARSLGFHEQGDGEAAGLVRVVLDLAAPVAATAQARG
ncbi:MAG: GNAT family N-acetyltransferase [Pseudoxanthomonas sp.]